MHAQRIAAEQRLVHSTEGTEDLQKILSSAHVGENIQRGPSIKKMHLQTLQNMNSYHRRNLRSELFNEMGMGTAKGRDGRLYMVQLFRYKNEDDVSETEAN
jgi:uncharacterized protein YkwD